MDVLTAMLNLDGLEVVDDCIKDDGTWVLAVIPTLDAGVCPRCRRLCKEVRQRRPRNLIDLPISDRAVVLELQVLQFQCPECGRAFTPPYAGIAEGTYATERFLRRAVELVRFGNLARAAAFLRVPEKTLERWYYDFTARPAAAPPQPIRKIGIDELSLKKNTACSSP